MLASASRARSSYAGNGLRGYGKLIIIKHNNTFLSAYAHNREILVKEGQQVARGQKIAEMGDTDADQVKLHFEIRRLGKPVDPGEIPAAGVAAHRPRMSAFGGDDDEPPARTGARYPDARSAAGRCRSSASAPTSSTTSPRST